MSIKPQLAEIPIQPVNQPILCSPFIEPTAHWVYNIQTGAASQMSGRRPDGLTLILEIKGHENDQDRTKHQAAKRWVAAVNHWGKLSVWDFHVCKDPQMLERELQYLAHEHEKKRG